MAQRITMPKLGQTVEESTIVRWLKKEGDRVSKGDVLLEIETDKATLEVESFTCGTLLKILRTEGETVPVKEAIAFVGEPGESLPEEDLEKEKRKAPRPASPPAREADKPLPAAPLEKPERRPEEGARAPAEVGRGPIVEPAAEAGPEVFRISPRAARLAREKVIDPRNVSGSGPKGRIIERDVVEFLEVRGYDALKVTPAARELAAREGIDLLSVKNEPDASRITLSAVRRAIAEKPKPMSRMRQVIARRLSESFRSAPHFYVTVSADVTGLVALRSQLKAQEVDLTFSDFMVKAVALTLPEFPAVNSRTTDGKEIIWNSRINVGLAVAIEEGLLVPVVFDADRLDLLGIHSVAADLAARGRKGQLKPEEMQGSTFTISNMGMMDVENFTAIINPGESAILAVSSVIRKPVVVGDEVVIRSMMMMTLSADHRVIDGVLAARFLNAVKAKLEDIHLWKRLT